MEKTLSPQTIITTHAPATPKDEHHLKKEIPYDEKSQKTPTVFTESTAPEDGVSLSTNPMAAQTGQRFGPWTEEILWCVISLLWFAVIIGVLRAFDGRPLPSLPMNVTLNTFLAFFTTLTKASFMLAVCEALSQWKWNWFATNANRPLHDFQLFDDASRGAWGSFQLILTRLRGRHLATAGALLPIISVLTSPITQQVIQYPLRRAEVNGTAGIPAVRHFKTSEDREGYGSGPLVLSSTSGIASTHGNTRSVPPAPPVCTSEECTFPRFNTVGICADVRNITSELKVTRLDNTNKDAWTTVQRAILPKFANVDLSTAYNITLPRGSTCWAVNPLTSMVQVCGEESSFGNKDDIDFRLANFFTVPILYQMPRGGSYNVSTSTVAADNMTDPVFHAFEINVYGCVKTYEAHSHKGESNVTLLSSSHAVKRELTPQTIKLNCPHMTFNYTSWFCSNDFGDQSTMNDSTPLLVLKDPDNPDNPSLDPNDYYTVDLFSLATVLTYINFFVEVVWTWDETTRATTTTDGQSLVTMWGDILLSLTTTSDPAEQMAGLKLVASNLAEGYTNGMRLSPPMRNSPNGILIPGTPWGPVTFVDIRWGWLGFLAGEMALAAAFLAATVAATRRMRVTVLKSSALATFFAPAEGCRAAVGGVGRVGDMERRARGAYVRFTGSEMVLGERVGELEGGVRRRGTGDGERERGNIGGRGEGRTSTW